MDKKEYVIRQLGRTKNKKYEAYVVTRIIHLLDDLSIKFVTQQYVVRPEGWAMTDLYFPQFGVHIEVDEGQHFQELNIMEDKVREADIVNVTGHQIIRIDVTKTIEEINVQVSNVVTKIRQMKSSKTFIPWNIESEFDSEMYIKRGYIDIADGVAFKTIKDACNCFGHNYKNYMRGGATHPETDIMLWFPKLFPNGEWNNQISMDEEIITERNEDNDKAREHVLGHIRNKEKHKHKRIVFAKVKGNLGDTLYRFKGLYKLDTEASNEKVGLVWLRLTTRVVTYKSK